MNVDLDGTALDVSDRWGLNAGLVEAIRQRPVRILHLSDLHFDAAKAWDADPVLQGLSDAIQQFVTDGLAPDAVAITGDIAHKGQAADYERAEKWISRGLFGKGPPVCQTWGFRVMIGRMLAVGFSGTQRNQPVSSGCLSWKS